MRKYTRMLMVVFAAFLLFLPSILEAQRRGGGGGRGGGGFRGGGGGGRSMSARSSARMSVSRPSRASYGGGARAQRAARVDRPARMDRSARVDRTPRADRGDFNRGNFNREINRGDININRDISIDNNGGWWNRGYDGCCDHPIAAAAAVGTAAAAVGYAAGTAGTYYNTLPYYSTCTENLVNEVPYWDCGNDWYQPTFYGIDTAYLSVPPPL
jgi:hypothetical protein